MLYWFHHGGNRFQYNEKLCHYINNYEGAGLVITKENFRRCMALSIARAREIVGRNNWIVDSDLYISPNEDKIK